MYLAVCDVTKTPVERIESSLKIAGLKYTKNVEVPMKDIKHDTFFRDIDPVHVRRLADGIKNPMTEGLLAATPMIAYKQGRFTKMTDGNHRYAACRLTKKTSMIISYVLHEKPLSSIMYLLVNAAEGESNRFKLELTFGDKVSFWWFLILIYSIKFFIFSFVTQEIC